MRRKRRTQGPELKAKGALTAVQGDLTMAELVKKFDVHANQVIEWKKQLLSSITEVFGNTTNSKEESKEVVQALCAKIGQLMIENGFLERGLERIHGLRGKKWSTRMDRSRWEGSVLC